MVLQVVMSRDSVSPATMEAWQPLLKALTHDEVSNTLLPKMYLALKRTPDAALTVFAPMLSVLGVDLSPYAAEIVAAVSPQLRHARKENREAAVRIMSESS